MNKIENEIYIYLQKLKELPISHFQCGERKEYSCEYSYTNSSMREKMLEKDNILRVECTYCKKTFHEKLPRSLCNIGNEQSYKDFKAGYIPNEIKATIKEAWSVLCSNFFEDQDNCYFSYTNNPFMSYNNTSFNTKLDNDYDFDKKYSNKESYNDYDFDKKYSNKESYNDNHTEDTKSYDDNHTEDTKLNDNNHTKNTKLNDDSNRKLQNVFDDSNIKLQNMLRVIIFVLIISFIMYYFITGRNPIYDILTISLEVQSKIRESESKASQKATVKQAGKNSIKVDVKENDKKGANIEQAGNNSIKVDVKENDKKGANIEQEGNNSIKVDVKENDKKGANIEQAKQVTIYKY